MACGIPQKCSDRYAGLIRLYMIAALTVPAAATVAAVSLFGIPASLPPAAVTAVLMWAAVCLPEEYADTVTYTRHRDWLIAERGLIWRRTALVPRRQIQYVRLRRSPAERLFHLSTLVLVTSGGRVALRGLVPDDADRLRGLLEKGLT